MGCRAQPVDGLGDQVIDHLAQRLAARAPGGNGAVEHGKLTIGGSSLAGDGADVGDLRLATEPGGVLCGEGDQLLDEIRNRPEYFVARVQSWVGKDYQRDLSVSIMGGDT